MEAAKKEMNSTPKLIHFVWAGGDKPLPKNDEDKLNSNHHIILQWQARYPTFKIILWVDQISLTKEITDDYQRRGYAFIDNIDSISTFKNSSPSIFVTDIQALYKQAQDYFSQQEVIELEELIHYEMKGKFHPNYGASSDMLRYLILLIHGGAYFDSDILPGNASLLHHPAFNNIGNFSGFNMIEDDSNDAFICSAGHSFFIAALKKCIEKYRNQHPETFNTFDYQWRTLYRTGPALMVEVVPSLLRYRLKKDFIYQKDRIGQKNWTVHHTIPCSTFQEAIDLAVKSLLNEMKYMNVCRFSDHVRDVSLSLRENILSVLRKIISSQNEDSSWNEFVKKIQADYEQEISNHDPTYSRITFNGLTKVEFLNVINTSLRNKVKNGKNEDNFKVICKHIHDYLKNNQISSNKITRIIKKINQRYPSLRFYRCKKKPEILYLMGAYRKGGIKFTRITDILAEEGIFDLIFAGNKSEKIPSRLMSAYQHTVQNLQILKEEGILIPDLPVHASTLAYQDVFDLLEILQSDNNEIFSQVINQYLIEELDKLAITSVLASCAHQQEDIQNEKWRQYLEKKVPQNKRKSLVSFSGQEPTELNLATSMNIALSSIKKMVNFFEKRINEMSAHDQSIAINEMLFNDIYNELPNLISETEDTLGYAHLPFTPDAKLGITLFLSMLNLTGDTLLEHFRDADH